LREQLLVDRAGRRQTVRLLEGDERLAEKLTHPAVNFSRPKLVIIEKNLEPNARRLVINRERD
jgi:hypothetical protein